jgi:SAM-dependent methyltransferase
MIEAVDSNPPSTNRTHADLAAVIINFGCGVKTSDRCINVDCSIYILLYQNPWLLPLLQPVIGRDRAARVRAMSGKALFHDLKKGIPFADNSADAVYHSHLMEHIDRDHVGGFQKEIFRVLKPGGIQRVCVPDLERLVKDYVASLAHDDVTHDASLRHDERVAAMFEQSVRRAPAGARGRSAFRQALERRLLGDARARGETHQWMWDRVNIRAVLQDAGFEDIRVCAWNEGAIEGWEQMGLERASDGSEYKAESLYIECRKPATS